jgi:hypothetical protein
MNSKTAPDISSNGIDELQFRHPWEIPIFIVSLIINLALIVGAIILVLTSADWIAIHPFIHRHMSGIKVLAVAALFAPPAMVFVRHMRRANVRGNSVRLSADQIPLIYTLLEDHCRRLGGVPMPELYVTDRAVPAPGLGFSAWTQHCIALSARFIERKPEKSRDPISFFLASELGRIRLGQTLWWREVLVSYMSRIPYLRNPLTQVQALSRDRYGAFLEPNAIPGLLIMASGRRLISRVEIQQYLNDVRDYRGFWPMLSNLARETPHICFRLRALLEAGLIQIESVQSEAQVTEGKKHKNKRKNKEKQKIIDQTATLPSPSEAIK